MECLTQYVISVCNCTDVYMPGKRIENGNCQSVIAYTLLNITTIDIIKLHLHVQLIIHFQ